MRQRDLIPPEERFWDNIGDPTDDGCWPWTGSRTDGGYGRIWCGRRGSSRAIRAHRFAYEFLVGPVPVGLVIDHLCRNPSCVNPAHLEPVTQRVNVLRGRSPVAENAARDTCVHGHEFTPENTRIRPPGWRACRTCDRERCSQSRTRARLERVA